MQRTQNPARAKRGDKKQKLVVSITIYVSFKATETGRIDAIKILMRSIIAKI
jgi:hypothetical protein